MTRHRNKLLASIASAVFACLLQTAHAEPARVAGTSTAQLAFQLPEIDHQTLVEQVRILRSGLILRKQELLQAVADKKLDGGDALITVIMPGGLLYAGYKQARYEQAKNELARVSADIEEYSSDILAMQTGIAPIAIARLP
jgi:hypothetical protein